jgi:hypothetical protein
MNIVFSVFLPWANEKNQKKTFAIPMSFYRLMYDHKKNSGSTAVLINDFDNIMVQPDGVDVAKGFWS